MRRARLHAGGRGHKENGLNSGVISAGFPRAHWLLWVNSCSDVYSATLYLVHPRNAETGRIRSRLSTTRRAHWLAGWLVSVQFCHTALTPWRRGFRTCPSL